MWRGDGEDGSGQLQALLKRELGTSRLVSLGQAVGGCINEASSYETDTGTVFIKTNRREYAREMFDGEMVSLDKLGAQGIVRVPKPVKVSLDKLGAQGIVRVPKPVKVVDIPGGGAALVMENLDITSCLSKHAAALGQQLGRLHLKNREICEMEKRGESFVHKGQTVKGVSMFGFDVPTCCGYLPQPNQWTATWEEFYAKKIQGQIDMVKSKYNDRSAAELWSTILPKLPRFFADLDIFPSLLHGDLWSGNVSETSDGAVMFDPASFYGHSEFDLGITCLFGGFPSRFFSSYFEVIPKQAGYEKRLELYKLFHYLNHWNHFGETYKSSTLKTLTKIVKNCPD